MIVGIYAEGRGDLAVISNILKGILGIDRSDMSYRVPEFELDQTDLSTMSAEQYSSWTVVKKVCEEKALIDTFFDNPIEQESFIVIQIDTAERYLDGYGVKEPVKTKDIDLKEYSRQLRTSVVEKINTWHDNLDPDKVAYAIAVEETDAWVLTIYDDGKVDTSKYSNPKKELNELLGRKLSKKEKGILSAKAFEKYDWLSSPLKKNKALKVSMAKNESLKLFCDSLLSFIPKAEEASE